MSFLPEELAGAQKQARAQLPADHVGPLVEQQGQVAVAVDPLGEEMADDGFRGRPDDVRLLELLAAGDSHHRQFGREAFHVLSFLVEEALRNEQREVAVLMVGGFKALVELALHDFPNGVAVGLDDHAALDDLGGFRHVALDDDVLIPGGEILLAGSDGRFGHIVGVSSRLRQSGVCFCPPGDYRPSEKRATGFRSTWSGPCWAGWHRRGGRKPRRRYDRAPPSASCSEPRQRTAVKPRRSDRNPRWLRRCRAPSARTPAPKTGYRGCGRAVRRSTRRRRLASPVRRPWRSP